MNYHGTTGNDDIDGTDNADDFDLHGGGEDTANGAGGDDDFTMGGAFDTGDTIDGGAGIDIVSLNGNYFGARALHFAASTMNNVEQILLGAGHDYDLTFLSANIDAEFTVHAEALGANDRLILRTAGPFATIVLAGAGDDVLTKGSVAANIFDLRLGGNDTVYGGGTTVVEMGATLNAGDTIEGVKDIHLDGDYVGANRLVMGTHVVNASTVFYNFAGGHDYDVVMNDANLDGTKAIIRSVGVGASDSFRFNGSAEDDGFFDFNTGAADDRLTGGARGDKFHLIFGGNDTVFGGGGNDVIEGRDTISSADRIDGGDGNDTLSLAGIDYDLNLTKVVNVETLVLLGANDFLLKCSDAMVAAGKTLVVDARGGDSAHSANFDAGSETDGNVRFLVGSGVYGFIGGAGDDVVVRGVFTQNLNVDFSRGGSDALNGGGSFVDMGAALDPTDRLKHIFQLYLEGDYAGAHKLTMAADTIVDVGSLIVLAGHDYDITMDDGNLVNLATMTVSALTLHSSDDLVFDGSAETTRGFHIDAGPGDDTMRGGSGTDVFDTGTGGSDTVHGGPGDDTIYGGRAYSPHDFFDGGAGFDTLDLSGADYTLLPMKDNLAGIERMTFGPLQTYILEMVDGNVGAGKTMRIDGTLLSGAAHLHIDASRETDGTYVFLCGTGNDIIVGGHGDDIFHGGLGADVFLGGPGADRLDYLAADESTSTSYDTVHGFAGSVDRFDLDVTVTAINPQFNGGAVSSANFDDDMENAINAGHLGKHHAVLCNLSGGDFDGDTFLAVDANGVVGYQAGEDYLFSVIDFGSLTKSIFI